VSIQPVYVVVYPETTKGPSFHPGMVRPHSIIACAPAGIRVMTPEDARRAKAGG